MASPTWILRLLMDVPSIDLLKCDIEGSEEAFIVHLTCCERHAWRYSNSTATWCDVDRCQAVGQRLRQPNDARRLSLSNFTVCVLAMTAADPPRDCFGFGGAGGGGVGTFFNNNGYTYPPAARARYFGCTLRYVT